MSETTTADDAASPADDLPEEWKPEPRKWEWRDLFTAPMLAFKPKCMLIAAVTLVLCGLFCWGWQALVYEINHLGENGDKSIPILNSALWWAGLFGSAVIFSLGASLIAVFMKADLLDDEFLGLGEALGQWCKRLGAALMVPVFLVGVVAGFWLLIYLGTLLCSIPWVGSILLSFFYPLAYLLGLLFVLLTIAVGLSFFVFPSIVAIRKHGWFDNVIDTFEAVGTKPHVVVLNIVLTLLMAGVCFWVAHGSSLALSFMAGQGSNVPGPEASATLHRAHEIQGEVIPPGSEWLGAQASATGQMMTFKGGAKAEETYYKWFTGLVGGIWVTIITVFIAGYVLNVFIAGGMLTYLAVREDDYWDDEDMEDLDALAKELEEEAKREAEKAAGESGEAEDKETETKKEDGKNEEGKKAEDKETETKKEDDGGKKGRKKTGGRKKTSGKKDEKKEDDGGKKDEKDGKKEDEG